MKEIENKRSVIKDGLYKCPLCGNTETAKIVEEMQFTKIWNALNNDYNTNFSVEIIKKLSPSESTNLVECKECGLEYFIPAEPGNSEFYNHLTSSSSKYYSTEKWDFDKASEYIKPRLTVLDIACGSGAWLKIAKRQGADVYGIDTNPAAVEIGQRENIDIACKSLEDFSPNNKGRFDLVTIFQIVEHLTELQNFIKNAKDCLKPGGLLIVTVPNKLRIARSDFEPLDCPPHHLSRWTERQLEVLSSLQGMDLLEINYEIPTMDECRLWVRKNVASKRHLNSLWARGIGRLVFNKYTYSLLLKSEIVDKLKIRGFSVMAVLKKKS